MVAKAIPTVNLRKNANRKGFEGTQSLFVFDGNCRLFGEVRVDGVGGGAACAEGGSRREAESAAAAKLIEEFGSR